MLIYTVDKDFASKLDIGKAIVEKLTFYINPEMYQQEKAASSEYVHKNVEFEQQSMQGRATGKLVSSPEIRNAIKRISDLQHGKGTNTIYLTGKDGKVVDKNPDELG